MQQISYKNTTIYSDKSGGTTLQDHIVTFADGSKVDMIKKTIVNKGPGTISFEPIVPDDIMPGKRVATSTKSGSASKITIPAIDFPLVINSYDGDMIVVTTKAPQEYLDALELSVQGDTFVVKPTKSLENTSINIISTGGTSFLGGVFGKKFNIGSISGDVIVGDNSIQINGRNIIGEEKSEYSMDIKVPVGTDIHITTKRNPVTSSTLDADLTVVMQGTADVALGSVRQLDITNNSSGSLQVHKIMHRVAIVLQGSGKVNIDDLLADAADITTKGSGSIRVKSFSAATVNLIASGSGDIELSRGNITHMHAKASGSGDIDVQCAVDSATLSSSGSGDIKVMTVKNVISKKSSGSGDIKIKNT